MAIERLANIAANIGTIKRRVLLPVKAHKVPAQLVCFGPSLRRTWSLLDTTKTIITVSGAHDFLRGRGLLPDYHVEFDWRPHKAKHFTNPFQTVFYLASCVHPDLVSKVPDCSLWHAQQTMEESKLIRKFEKEAHLVPGGSSAGLRAIELFYALGYRHFEIHGMDSSFDDDAEWAGPHYGKSREKRDVIDVLAGGRRFKTSVAFLMYADQFRACKRALKDCSFNLHGDGLIQAMSKMEIAA